jgi:hypothetical protein
MDNVQIYKRTGRAISLTFMAVATNPEDFDEMWFAINKLVTLVYPQYSRGTQRQSSAGDKFIMPFSQIPTASPLIRLRVGDLFTSNRNPASERRNFGIGTESFKSAPAAPPEPTLGFEIPALSVGGEVTQQDIEKAIKDNGLLPSINPLLGPTVGIKAGSILKEVDGKASVEFKQTTKAKITSVDVLEKAKKDLEQGSWVYVVEVQESTDTNLAGKKFTATIANFTALPSSLIPQEMPFLDPTSGVGGSIIRSFDAAGGEGLAGMISQLDFDWMLNTMLWDVDDGRRAPMGCKITISFTPIHDYQLGLNDSGEINAPAYMVGNNTRQYFAKSSISEQVARSDTKSKIEDAKKALEKSKSTSDAKPPESP